MRKQHPPLMIKMSRGPDHHWRPVMAMELLQEGDGFFCGEGGEWEFHRSHRTARVALKGLVRAKARDGSAFIANDRFLSNGNFVDVPPVWSDSPSPSIIGKDLYPEIEGGY